MQTLVFGTETVSANKLLATETVSVNKHFKLNKEGDQQAVKGRVRKEDRAALMLCKKESIRGCSTIT